MINKKRSDSKMRYAALKKENLRLQRKVYTQEAKIVTMRSELRLRPSFPPPKIKAASLSVKALNDWTAALPKSTEKGSDAT